ncbi:hypothetical protein OIU74_001571 [Salix koriyanagi]|uniref:Uncharacterized protein n=1 Tax=Salix koriyanagi TaxID=2511006 RepID=A0A9Q1ANL2_9ROSI|nr:hypothetical protein OIU74_001571 [Salix koriyanagi]
MMRTVSFADLFFKQLSCFKKLHLLLDDGHYSQRKKEEITGKNKNKNKSGGGEGEAKQKQTDDQQSQ